MNETQINKILETAIGGCKTTADVVKRATAQLLGEAELKVGQKVAVVDAENTVGGFVGGAKVKSLPDNLSGQVELELENGTSVYAISSLVIPI